MAFFNYPNILIFGILFLFCTAKANVAEGRAKDCSYTGTEKPYLQFLPNLL
jgi:hypothetical protein